MLPAKCRNPEVVDRDRRAGALHFQANFGVSDSGALVDVEADEQRKHVSEPTFMLRPAPRLQDAERYSPKTMTGSAIA
jgi:hypothetical protein